jgi:hypothetical protein
MSTCRIEVEEAEDAMAAEDSGCGANFLARNVASLGTEEAYAPGAGLRYQQMPTCVPAAPSSERERPSCTT